MASLHDLHTDTLQQLDEEGWCLTHEGLELFALGRATSQKDVRIGFTLNRVGEVVAAIEVRPLGRLPRQATCSAPEANLPNLVDVALWQASCLHP